MEEWDQEGRNVGVLEQEGSEQEAETGREAVSGVRYLEDHITPALLQHEWSSACFLAQFKVLVFKALNSRIF